MSKTLLSNSDGAPRVRCRNPYSPLPLLDSCGHTPEIIAARGDAFDAEIRRAMYQETTVHEWLTWNKAPDEVLSCWFRVRDRARKGEGR